MDSDQPNRPSATAPEAGGTPRLRAIDVAVDASEVASRGGFPASAGAPLPTGPKDGAATPGRPVGGTSLTARPRLGSRWRQVMMAGCVVDLMDERTAIALIVQHARDASGPALGVMSANLDHVHHFGRHGRWQGTVGEPTLAEWREGDGPLAWLDLLDGSPLVSRARVLSGRQWPRLAGSDLIAPILDAAGEAHLRIGFLGGSSETQELLRDQLAQTRPGLAVVGWWSPPRASLTDPEASARLAAEVRAAGADILVVGLGKPRQELWIAEYGPQTGARVLLAFGAVVDFLAGRVQRAPEWAREHGLEWAWRLALEPRRLARRYLVQGPPAMAALDQGAAWPAHPIIVPAGRDAPAPCPLTGTFVGPDEAADVAVLVVTHNNAADVEPLIQSLRREARSLAIRVVVADNASEDGTFDALRAHPDVVAFDTGGNWGYAGGINRALERAGEAEAHLVLNPDLVVSPGALTNLLGRLRRKGVGASVPLLQDADGALYPSLRREPTILRALGDALAGSKGSPRPGWASEVDHDPDSYRHPHPVDWATGAAILVRASAAEDVGTWDERYFLYSEEVDYCRRLRDAGAEIWFEPTAVMTHRQGGSGSSPALVALQAVNRVRYFRAYHGRARSMVFGGVVLAGALARSWRRPGERAAVAALLSDRRRNALPRARATRVVPPSVHAGIEGSVVIPAHDEAQVIGRTLGHLAPLAESGELEVVVVCNGCTDETEAVARSFPGIHVVAIEESSKTAALNAGDDAASRWPRLYLDADVEIRPATISALFAALDEGAVLAARPASAYDTQDAGGLVRAYYRARSRMPTLHSALWGAGAYAMSKDGRARFDRFPDVVADDLWVDRLFTVDEKATVASAGPVVVRTPRDLTGLTAILRRTYRGNRVLGDGAGHGSATARDLLRTVRGPASAADALVYGAMALRGRLAASAGGPGGWERDESSRTGPASS